jgi:hypothetical protein
MEATCLCIEMYKHSASLRASVKGSQYILFIYTILCLTLSLSFHPFILLIRVVNFLIENLNLNENNKNFNVMKKIAK